MREPVCSLHRTGSEGSRLLCAGKEEGVQSGEGEGKSVSMVALEVAVAVAAALFLRKSVALEPTQPHAYAEGRKISSLQCEREAA